MSKIVHTVKSILSNVTADEKSGNWLPQLGRNGSFNPDGILMPVVVKKR
jgi:hypothetical protein